MVAEGVGVKHPGKVMRRPEPIPETVPEQAVYWKRFYNTRRGHGTVELYLDKWTRLCLPTITAGAGAMA